MNKREIDKNAMYYIIDYGFPLYTMDAHIDYDIMSLYQYT